MNRARVSRIFFLISLTLFAQGIWAGDALNFFNNWFVTGDYVTAGVGLRGQGVNGFASGSINVPALPAGAEPVAAWLYWSTIEFTPAPFGSDGYFNGQKIRGAVVGNPQNPGCWSSGGTAGASGATGRSYRADVLRYLPVNASNIRQVSGAQTVKLPDSGGTGNGNVIFTNGATLVVIYRVIQPGNPLAAPLRAVVGYNGAFSMDKNSAGATQNVAGFYQASTGPNAKLTFIVANGQSGFSSPLSVNGITLATAPFVGGDGGRWDDPTLPFNLPANASSFSTLITPGTNQACLTVVAAFASMNVPDSDKDGLLDFWEMNGLHRNTQVSPATFGGCSDYPAEACVNLPAMGAVNGTKDVFMQIDWMHGNGDGTVGLDGRGFHVHKPNPAALSAVCATFAGHGIAMHFDVGNNYQGQPCIVPYKDASGNVLAQGGSDIDEFTLLCADTASHTCLYHQPYPVLSFEFGFASVRDGNQKANIPAHLAQARKDTHHYALFAHALAGPFNALGQPVDPFTGTPSGAPRSYSGIAQRPGGGFMVTLGLWRSDIPANDQVGSALVQAGTLMHEVGHNFGLGHNGLSIKPNCAPNYQSIMNYAYQTRGLTDAAGLEHIDYSNGTLLPLNENSLSATASLGSLQYRPRFFGPPVPGTPAGATAKVHCDGTPITDGALGVRLESPIVGTPDWSNGTVTPLGTVFPLDVNFNGTKGEAFADQPDWTSLNLQQIGTGPNFGGLSVGAWATDGGAYATDGGAWATDAGALATDGGAFATDGGAWATDGGAFATDGGAWATDGGAFATDGGAWATDAGDEDYDTHNASGPDAPTGLTPINELSDVLLSWTAPGAVDHYDIYRCVGTGCLPALFRQGWVPASKAAPTFTDTVNDFIDSAATCPATSTCYNTIYTYAIVSNAVATVNGVTTVTASGLSLAANSEVTHLFVMAVNQAAVYGAAVPAPAYTVYGDVAGSLPSGSVTCIYPGPAPRNAGSYAVSCSGPAATSPTNGVTYNAAYLTYTPGALTISPQHITVAAATSAKFYDGGISSTATPTITLASLAYSDIAAWTESYDNPTAGTTHVMTPAGTVSDGNGGNNYIVTFLTIATGVINPAPLVITASSTTVPYRSPVPAITASYSGFVNAETNSVLTAQPICSTTYAQGSPVGIYPTSCSRAAAVNYSISFTAGTLTVNRAILTITAKNQSKTYGTVLSFTGTEFTSAGLITGDSITSVTLSSAGGPATATVAGSPYTIVPTSAVGTGLTNYTITYVNGAFTVNPAPLTITGKNQSKTYGTTFTFTGAEFTIGGTLYNGDAVTSVSLTSPGALANAPVAGSPYAIVASSAAGSGLSNYAMTYVNGILTVIPAPLTITTLPAAKVYGDPLPIFSVTYSGFVLGENPSVLAGTLIFTTSATPTSPVGGSPYLVTPGGLASANYAITFVPGSLVVTKATPVLSSLSSPTIPAGSSPTLIGGNIGYATVFPSGSVSITVNGSALNAEITVAAGGFSASFATGAFAVGVYPVSYSYPGDGNFNPANGGGTLHVQGFVATGSMGTTRSWHAAARLTSGKVLVAGGLDSSGSSLASAEVYNPTTGTFSATANNMPNKADHFTLTLLPNGMVLAAGGGNSSAQLYNPSTDTWSSTGGMSAQRSNHTATLLPNGKVLIAGGTNNSGVTQSSAQLFDPSTASFSSTGSMTVARDFHTATLLPNGKVLIAGGRTGSKNSYSYLQSAEIYDPANGAFTAAGNMAAIRYSHAAVLVNGKVLMAGGANSTAAIAGAEIYDPTAGTFNATGALATTRQYFTAAVLGSGNVLEAGGLNGSTRLQDSEQYQGGLFVPGGKMTAPRAAHTATVLNNGYVLVVGGQGSAGASVATAELFEAP
jgi:hypothetical protein